MTATTGLPPFLWGVWGELFAATTDATARLCVSRDPRQALGITLVVPKNSAVSLLVRLSILTGDFYLFLARDCHFFRLITPKCQCCVSMRIIRLPVTLLRLGSGLGEISPYGSVHVIGPARRCACLKPCSQLYDQPPATK
jgi:hypothetical protein